METTRYDDLLAASGLEVESASLHMPTGSTEQSHMSEPNWKTRAMASVSRARSTISNRVDAARRNPAVVAGAAGLAGVAAGILGHMLRRRMRPEAGFLIVETCY